MWSPYIALLEHPTTGHLIKGTEARTSSNQMIVPGSLGRWRRISRRWALTHLRDVTFTARSRGHHLIWTSGGAE